MAEVVVVDAASIPVVLVDEDDTEVVLVDQVPVVPPGLLVQSPPLTRLTVDTQLLAPAPAFVELIGVDLTLTVGSRIRARTYICGKGTTDAVDANITALLTPSGQPTQQGANASCFRAGTTSPQSAAVENEFGGLSPGDYRVSLAWRVSSGPGVEVNPVTVPNSESAVLTVEVLT